MRISFFFPAYFDEATVEPLALLADDILGEICSQHEIIVVDDASPDRSGEIADSLAEKNPNIQVIHHTRNRGYGQALWSGIQASRYEWIAFTDGDMQYDLRELPRLVEAARAGADAVIGYKTSRADGFKRRAASRIYNAGIRILFGLRLRDADCAFKLMHKSIFEEFTPSTHYTEAFILVEALYRAGRRGARILEVPVSHRPRPHGDSRCFTWRTARRLAWYALRGAVVGRLLGAWR